MPTFINPKVGDTFNQWTIVAGPNRNAARAKTWTCVCSCGTQREVPEYTLVKGITKSCGHTREVSASTRELLSLRRINQPAPWAKGKKHSEETKEKMKAAWALRKAAPTEPGLHHK